MNSLAEKHRPRDWSEVVAQPKAVALLRNFEGSERLSGRAFWVAGKSGTGKTTLARIIGAKVAEPMNTYEYDAGDIGVDDVRQWHEDQNYIPWGGKRGRVLIINEAHGLSTKVIRRLLVFLEDLADWTTVIFTTTKEGQSNLFDDNIDGSPLMSRCVIVPMAGKHMAQLFAEHVQTIAAVENLAGKNLKSIRKLVDNNKSNLRAVWQLVESGALLV